jgi:NAD(P)-dependent dehydrogenase (short-subunit alcohol dehydrogenase family)
VISLDGMTDKITIVTGAGRGIGAATAARLAAAGHDIVVNYRSDATAAEKTADVVRATGRRAITVQADITRETDIDRLFDVAATDLGPITGLVNNAGVTGPLGAFMDVTTATFRSVIDINVIAYLLCAQRAARAMAISRGGQGGSIVNVSSGAATTGSPGEYVHYAAAKAAVDTMTLGLSKELGPEGIRVNAVQPGRIWTRIHADMGDATRPAKINDIAPLRRAGQPDEVAAAIAWLMSDDASYTTGAILRVAGGL